MKISKQLGRSCRKFTNFKHFQNHAMLLLESVDWMGPKTCNKMEEWVKMVISKNSAIRGGVIGVSFMTS